MAVPHFAHCTRAIMSDLYSPGRYWADVVSQGFSESGSAAKTPFFYLELRIVARSGTGMRMAACPVANRQVRWYLSDNPVCRRILAADLGRLGVVLDSLTRLMPDSENALTFIGRRIEVDCADEIYDGRSRERWRIARPVNPLSASRIQAIDEQYRAEPTPPRECAEPPNATPPPDEPVV